MKTRTHMPELSPTSGLYALKLRSAKLRAFWTHWHRANRTTASLRALSDRSLADIGISRPQIWSVAKALV